MNKNTKKFSQHNATPKTIFPLRKKLILRKRGGGVFLKSQWDQIYNLENRVEIEFAKQEKICIPLIILIYSNGILYYAKS